MILAAMIIGSSIIMSTDNGPKVMDVPVLAFKGMSWRGLSDAGWFVRLFVQGECKHRSQAYGSRYATIIMLTVMPKY